MSYFAEGAFNGEYPVSPPEMLAKAQFIFGHEFGAPKKDAKKNGSTLEEVFGLVNVEIAQFIYDLDSDLPIYAAETVAGALGELGVAVEGVVYNTTSTFHADEGGTWAELIEVEKLLENEEKHVLHVGQAYHAGRIAAHSAKFGFHPHLPPGLPTMFDPDSKQRWTRSAGLWAVREAPGTLFLKLKNQL